MKKPSPTRRDREIIIDTAVRLYTVRRPLSTGSDDHTLLETAISDAFDVVIPLLYADASERSTPTSH